MSPYYRTSQVMYVCMYVCMMAVPVLVTASSCYLNITHHSAMMLVDRWKRAWYVCMQVRRMMSVCSIYP